MSQTWKVLVIFFLGFFVAVLIASRMPSEKVHAQHLSLKLIVFAALTIGVGRSFWVGRFGTIERAASPRKFMLVGAMSIVLAAWLDAGLAIEMLTGTHPRWAY